MLSMATAERKFFHLKPTPSTVRFDDKVREEEVMEQNPCQVVNEEMFINL